jgi:hypothetical protein
VILLKNWHFKLVCPGFEMFLGPPMAKPEQSIANYGGYRKLRRMSVLCISPRLAAEVETLHNSDLADLIEQKAAAATEMCAWGKERMWRTGALLEEPMTRRIGPDRPSVLGP